MNLEEALTFAELRASVVETRISAQDFVRNYGQLKGVEPRFLNAIVAAIGEISVGEALTGIDNLMREK